MVIRWRIRKQAIEVGKTGREDGEKKKKERINTIAIVVSFISWALGAMVWVGFRALDYPPVHRC